MEAHIQDTLNDLAHMLGIDVLIPNVWDVVSIEFEHHGMLMIDAQINNVFMYLVDNFESRTKDMLQLTMSLCHPIEQQPPINIHPIMIDEYKLGFLSKFSSSNFILPYVDTALNLMLKKMEYIKQIK